METLEIIGLLLTLAAVLAYLNHRLLKLPATIGLMLGSLVLSLGLLAAEVFVPGLADRAEVLLTVDIDFPALLLEGMLGFLLFAGALHVNLNDLAAKKWPIAIFASVGVVGSTLLIAGGVHLVSLTLGLGLPMMYCLLFGALISPTDPIAVLAILKKANAPKGLETTITGESLFNDGIGVVVFLALLEILDTGHVSVPSAVGLFVTEAVGGAALGLVLGYLAYRLIRSIDEYTVEVLLTLALVTGGYALASHLHVSGPIAMVVSGLLIGNHGRRLGMSDRTREHLDTFWELIDEGLNAVLFVLIGLEVLVVALDAAYLAAGALAVVVALAARATAVGVPVWLLQKRQKFAAGAVKILTWGGLRGGISIALAMSLPPGRPRQVIVTMTYVVVAFSILVQGLTIGRLIRRTTGRAA